MIGFGHSASAAELVVDEIAREARSGRYALAPTPTANRRLVLVVGCHRSGTSLVTRSLLCLGAELGTRLMPAGQDNPTGFWENQDAYVLHETTLRHMGHRWDDVDPWGPALTQFADTPEGRRFSRAIEWLLRQETMRYPVFALKDSRISRLLPFYRPILAAVGAEVSVVHVIRHPMAVAASLNKRNGMPIEQGLALWLEHNRRVRDDVDPAWKTVVASYEEMMDLPHWSVSRIGAALGLEVSNAATERFVAEFLSADLQHEHGGDIRDAPTEVADLWTELAGEAMR